MKKEKNRTIIKKRKRHITIVFIFLKLPPTSFAGSTGIYIYIHSIFLGAGGLIASRIAVEKPCTGRGHVACLLARQDH